MASEHQVTTRPTSINNTRERRPFSRLSPLLVPREVPEDLQPGLRELDLRVGDDVQTIVRSLVNFTVSRQIAAQREAGRPVGVALGVLNRRRRAARAWINAILAGQVDEDTRHNVARAWVPQLAGTGPDLEAAIPAGADFLEFIRGSVTALVMHEFAENLVPHAKALNALETVLSLHLRALREDR